MAAYVHDLTVNKRGPAERPPPGLVPFVSCWPGAYGHLLLTVYERRLTGLLVSSDWLRPVKWGGWRTGFPDRGHSLADVSRLGSGLYKGCLTVWRLFGSGLLTGWCIYAWTVRQYFFVSVCDLIIDRESSTDCTALTRRSTIMIAMTGLGQSSAIAAYQSQASHIKWSHDENGSIQMNIYSLGVMDLDLSISPDVFGIRVFDDTKPVTRMLPGSSPCELRLMPDNKLANDGFHDVIENLSGTPLGGRHTFRRRK